MMPQAPSSSDRDLKFVYRWSIVLLLLIISITGYVDRLVLGFLVDPIKRDLGLSDTQAGLINGLAFAMFYVLMGIPMGRLVDRMHRGWLLSISVGTASAMTALCAAATNFATLFTARMGVGASEAALNPAAISLISEIFPKERVAKPIGIFSLGVYFGGGMAILLGGQLVAHLQTLDHVDLPFFEPMAAWRAVFLVVGLPGLILAALLPALIRDRRQRDAKGTGAGGPSVSYLGHLRHNRLFYLYFLGALIAYGFNLYGLLAWFPTMLMRTYGLEAGTIATPYGAVYLVAGIAGGMSFATMIRWLEVRHGRLAPLVLSQRSVAIMLFCSIAAPLMPIMPACLALTAGTIFTWAMTTGTSFVVIATVAPPALRGTVTSLYMVVMNITGGALAALIVGLLSDHVFGEAGIRYSMAVLAAISLPTAIMLFSRARRELARMDTGST